MLLSHTRGSCTPAAMQACPGDDTITLMVCGQLDGARIATLESHVVDCASCRKVVGILQTALPHLGRGSRDAIGASMIGLLAPGTIVGRYRIEDMLGAGGMGVVYAAHDPELDRKVALKLLYPTLSADGEDELATRLRHESKAMARLRHPNVATIHDLGSFRDQMFLVMELVDGTTLRAWVGHGTPWETVVATFVEAGKGLAAAHEAGIVHCDFKPDNVLLDAGGRPLITDFGLAHVVAGVSPRPLPSTPLAVTALGSSSMVGVSGGHVFGTPAYMAPERFDATIAADVQGDVFAFCVALYEVLYGRRPFEGTTVDELRSAIASAPKPPEASAVPAWLHAVIARGLSPDRAIRYRGMRELLDALQPRPRRSHRTRWLAAGLAVAALGAIGWRITRSPAIAAAATCDARGELAGIWDDGAKTRIGAAWPATASGARSWDRVRGALDRYSDAWVGASDAACKAPSTSATVAAFQHRCLRSIGVQLRAVTGQLADPKLAVTGDRTVASLPSVEGCNTSAPIAPVPSDPWMRVEVDRLRDEIAVADGRSIAGKFDSANSVLDDVAKRAALVGFKPLLAEVQYSRAMNLRGAAAKPEVTTAALRDAAAQAEASGEEVVAVKAWTALAFQAGEVTGDFARGREYASYATAALERLGGNARLEAMLDTTKGRIDWHDGKLDDARREYEQAASLAKTDPVPYIEALSGMASVDSSAGRLAAALDEDLKVLKLRHDLYGDVHPETARSYTQLGDVTMRLTRFEEALGYYKKADDAAQRVYGPEHSIVQITAHNLGGVLRELHRPAEAETSYRRAVRIATTAYGPDHPYTAKSEQGLGMALCDEDKCAEGVTVLRHAVAVDRKAYGDNEIATISAENDLAIALRDVGKLDEALAYTDKAIAGFTVVEPASDDLVTSYEARGQTLIAAHRNRDAIAALDKAAAIASKLEGSADRLTDIHTLLEQARSNKR